MEINTTFTRIFHPLHSRNYHVALLKTDEATDGRIEKNHEIIGIGMFSHNWRYAKPLKGWLHNLIVEATRWNLQ